MLDQLVASVSLIVSQTQTNIYFITLMLILLWGIYILNLCFGKALLGLGILPRHLSGIPGIFFAPFLHADFNHLFFNSIPLVILANFVLIQGQSYFLHVTACII